MLRKPPTPPKKLLNQGSLAEVPWLLCQVPSFTFPSLLLSFRGPPVPPGRCSSAPLPPQSWRSWAASVARGPGPQTGTPLPATLQGPLSALQGAAPLANRGRVGRGRLARPVCDRARATERTRELRWAVLGGKVGAPLPACLNSLPRAQAGASGRDPGMCGAGHIP